MTFTYRREHQRNWWPFFFFFPSVSLDLLACTCCINYDPVWKNIFTYSILICVSMSGSSHNARTVWGFQTLNLWSWIFWCVAHVHKHVCGGRHMPLKFSLLRPGNHFSWRRCSSQWTQLRLGGLTQELEHTQQVTGKHMPQTAMGSRSRIISKG